MGNAQIKVTLISKGLPLVGHQDCNLDVYHLVSPIFWMSVIWSVTPYLDLCHLVTPYKGGFRLLLQMLRAEMGNLGPCFIWMIFAKHNVNKHWLDPERSGQRLEKDVADDRAGRL